MNLNFTHKNDYNLNKKLIDEMIRMYGIECKLLLVEKNHVDPEVFGDWDSINTKCEVKSIHLLPENADDMDHSYPFGDFGFNTLDTSTVFLSAYEFECNSLTIKQLLSSLIVFPSNKVLEITDATHQVPGVNHLWSYSDEKSAYKLTLRTYEFRLHDETDGNTMCSVEVSDDFSPEFGGLEDKLENTKDNYDPLDGYFDTLLKEKSDVEYEAEVRESTIINDNKKSPVVVNNEKDPFGW
jgi:hypothetical protein